MARPPLHAVADTEDPPASTPNTGGGPPNGGSGYGERLARIEGRMGYLATREDVSEIKVLIERKESTMLRWLLGLVVVAIVTLLAAILRTFIAP